MGDDCLSEHQCQNIVRYCFLELTTLGKYTLRVKVQLKHLRKWFYVKFSARVRPCESLNIVNEEKNIKFTVLQFTIYRRPSANYFWARDLFAQNSIYSIKSRIVA